jgi:hypothetical protein
VDEWVRRFDPKSRWGATRIHSITQVDRTGVPAFLRASGLPLLPTDNPHVASDLKKIRKTQPLSPILLVRGDVTANRAAQIADGYHRVCASYHVDENTDIPCRIVDLPPGH